MTELEKIGKYQILERIGRGGMGTIFKAHDPILKRPVALKVISPDVDITDEIRARFFREAQACARLSHPNIVTVYDMGEDAGRMFIVMELLDGVELRRLIADRVSLPIEEKLSIMMQVCDGLHYAHQRGIVHRDVKPSNIMRLGNGQVKILDFGIAQIENLHETLTRTGLVVGTLRYVAPEQLRGRADHRADIYSVGVVLYEFLSLRSPYSARDTLQLIEQLRTEDATPLHRVDPTIPSDLSDLVEQAMQKDPDARLSDLAQVRTRIEQVQRARAEEARRLNERTRAQRDRLQRLQAALAARVGSSGEDTAAMIEPPRHLAALEALEADLLARIQTAKGMLARADALTPAFERGSGLLEAGQFTEAIAVFEGIIAEMPQHALAADGLTRARAQADAERRRQLASTLIQDARGAAVANEYALCLEILKQASEIPPPEDVVPHIVSLRAVAETAMKTHGAAPAEPRERAPAFPAPSDAQFPAPSDAEKVRRTAEPIEAMEDVPGEAVSGDAGPWRSTDAGGQKTGSRRFPGVAHDDAPRRGNGPRWTLWAGGTVLVVGGVAAVAMVLSHPRSPHISPGSSGGPPVTNSAQPPVASPPAGGADATAQPQKAPQTALGAGTPAERPPPERPAGAGKSGGGSQPDRPVLPPPTPRRPDEQGAESRPVGVRRDAEQAGARTASARRDAETAAAAFYAPQLLGAAQAKETEGTAALRRADYSSAIRLLGEAQSDYHAAAQEARRQAETERQTAPLRARVEQAREAALARRRQALAAQAERLAMDPLRVAETRHAEADSLAARQSFAAAARAYDEAAERYAEAALRAQAAAGTR